MAAHCDAPPKRLAPTPVNAMSQTFHRVAIPYAVFGLVAGPDGCIQDVAPIGRWMVGKSLEEVREWVRSKQGHMLQLGDDDE